MKNQYSENLGLRCNAKTIHLEKNGRRLKVKRQLKKQRENETREVSA